jgi:hypothetical protein
VMSDGVLAAIIAASATVFASFLQIRSSFAKEMTGRTATSSSRRKSRLPFMFLCVMLGGAGVGGFALSQWLTEHERTVQNELQRALQERIATMSRTENALEQTRAGTRAEIEAGVLRELGMQGVVVSATVAACKPPILMNTPALAAGAGETPAQMPSQSGTSSAPSSTCTEADASPITLCATIPATATLTDVELYVRAAGSDVPWPTARVTAGHEFEQARFAEKPVEVQDGSSTKQVCQGFAQWSTERARVARMLVRYSL